MLWQQQPLGTHTSCSTVYFTWRRPLSILVSLTWGWFPSLSGFRLITTLCAGLRTWDKILERLAGLVALLSVLKSDDALLEPEAAIYIMKHCALTFANGWWQYLSVSRYPKAENEIVTFYPHQYPNIWRLPNLDCGVVQNPIFHCCQPVWNVYIVILLPTEWDESDEV